MKRVYPIMFVVSLSLVAISIVALATWGLNLGVDFTGGSLLEVSFTERPAARDVVAAVTDADVPALSDPSASPAGDNEMLIRVGPLNEEEHQALVATLTEAFPDAGVAEQRFDSIGPAIGSELASKSIRAIILVLVAIVLYIAFVFRAMRRALSPWAMGLAALVALAHDLVIPMGLFAWLGHAQGVQISAVFVAAVLTILGYSVADTVVIFDRMRENIVRGMSGSLASVMHTSVMQTLVRSLNTTLTTLAALVAIWLFGGSSIQYFALALIVGIACGTYSSIFVASPLLVWLGKKRR